MKVKPAKDFIGPPGHPDLYPGLRPEKSYVLAPHPDGMMVYHILDNDIDIRNIGECHIYDGEKETKLKDFFFEKTGYKIEDTIPVITYGASVNPMSLMKKLEGFEDMPELVTVPTIKGSLKGYDVVYTPRISTYGSIPATLVPSEGTTVECWLNLFLPIHMPHVHKKEGCFKEKKRTYDLAILPSDFIVGSEIKPYCYVGGSGRVFVGPLSFAGSDYIGERGNLIANIDFVPIDAENRKHPQKAHVEVMAKINDISTRIPWNDNREHVFINPSDRERKFEYRLTDWGRENRKQINEYLKEYSKIMKIKDAEIVEDPHNIDSLKRLKDII